MIKFTRVLDNKHFYKFIDSRTDYRFNIFLSSQKPLCYTLTIKGDLQMCTRIRDDIRECCNDNP